MLHGWQQHYIKIKEIEKTRKLFHLLNALEFNQVVIFVKSVQRCIVLETLRNESSESFYLGWSPSVIEMVEPCSWWASGFLLRRLLKTMSPFSSWAFGNFLRSCFLTWVYRSFDEKSFCFGSS